MKLIHSLLIAAFALSCSARPLDQFVLLSDIHFNPLADPALVPQLMAADASQWESIFAADPHPAIPAYLSDTVWSLFASVVGQVQNVQPRPKLVVVTGDILAHKLQSKFASITQANDAAAFRNFEKKTVEFIGIELEKASGGVPVYFTLGNNDEDCGDYALQPDGPFLKDSAATIQTLSKSDTKAMASWVTLGSYVAENPLASHHRIIVLNTNFWSGRYKNTCGSGDSGPAVLSWLSDQLQDAKKNGRQSLAGLSHSARDRWPYFVPYEAGCAFLEAGLPGEFRQAAG